MALRLKKVYDAHVASLRPRTFAASRPAIPSRRRPAVQGWAACWPTLHNQNSAVSSAGEKRPISAPKAGPPQVDDSQAAPQDMGANDCYAKDSGGILKLIPVSLTIALLEAFSRGFA